MDRKLPLDELSLVIARIEGLLLTAEKVDRAVQLLAQAIKDAVPGSIGAGVSLLDSRGRRTSNGATDRVVEEADALQYQLGQGPCLTAWAAEETVIIQDVATEPRWPQWSAAVASLPIRSVISTALISQNECIGALKVYAALPSAYTDATARMLERFAAPAATLLAHVQASELPHRISRSLQTSLHSRDLVNRACGVLMERHGIGDDEALQALMLQAREARVPLQQFSASLVAGTPAASQ
ncbi:GAF and ANTAR domain-containing protein [Arthrobacter crystallopoietes]|uniref:ANTAR domain-containing protein n=1 Tax=Crystallibacter crystallopoietes TaxID=37928 RepID=A0A1H0ZU37_9MICC|nr:GAF and ANTAR domain-containing protein [Arthrobacter crystallopoietes]AUI51816.1 histidine kinase [Arthrobacter crystallopoietes]SDQ30890.1 ANTAR domain-containing protein [Arthrobacter crystallopoietes]